MNHPSIPSSLLDVEEILDRRAERARAVSGTDEAEAAVLVAEFGLAKDRYAVPLSALRAVMPLKQVAPVPKAPAHVIGIARFQGQLITVVSLMALLGVKGWRQDCAVLLVLEREDGHRFAVDCEHIPRIEALPQRAVAQARARGAGPLHDVTTAGLEAVALIDVDALLPTGGETAHG